MSKGKHVSAGNGGGWRKGGDPFQEEKAPKKAKVKKEKNAYGWHGLSTGKKVAAVAGGCLAVLIAVAVGWWLLFVRAPNVEENVLPNVVDNNPNPSLAEGDRTDTEKDTPDSTTAVPGRKDQVYTFLLLGKDTGGGGNTDTMILVSYDVPNGTVDCVSIPRDTMINVTWSIKKINAVFASSRGIDGLKEEVGHLTGIVPDFYVAVEWEAIGKIVDALGGVEFDVPYNMSYDDPYQDLHIHQSKGLRKLDGDDAMQVIRWRKNNKSDGGFEIGDNGRQQVQQDFLKAVAKQCLQIGNWTKISQFAQIFFENVETDIKLENLLWFAQKAMGVSMDNVTFYSLPGNPQGSYYTPSLGSYLAYFFADPAGIVELMNEHFNPYSRDITEADLQIMYKTKNAALGVTNGTLASASMSNPSVKPKNSTTKSDPEEPASTPGDDGEATLPGTEVTTEPGTTGTDPGTAAAPGTTTDPGTTTNPGTVTDSGATPDPSVTPDPGTAPGTGDPGATVDPGVTEPEGGGTTPDPEPVPEPTPEPSPEPTADPAPELPSEPEPEPVLPEE